MAPIKTRKSNLKISCEMFRNWNKLSYQLAVNDPFIKNNVSN